MRTFNEFNQILQEKKKELTKGIVVSDPPDLQVHPDGTTTYNLSNSPRPKETEPGSPERAAQVAAIMRASGAKAFRRLEKQKAAEKLPKPKPKKKKK